MAKLIKIKTKTKTKPTISSFSCFVAGSLVYPVITWLLMSSHYFFSSGHQATIPSIRFEAAFVGLPGDMKNVYLPGKTNELRNFLSW